MSPMLKNVDNAEILKYISYQVAGEYGALLLNLVVAFACFTTAMALASVFANYLHEQIFKKKISSAMGLAITLVVTCAIASLEFNGIALFLGPIIKIVYPIVIAMGIIFLIAISKKKSVSAS
jgi:LIVCS family branched-chain amino acid:cation transporter